MSAISHSVIRQYTKNHQTPFLLLDGKQIKKSLKTLQKYLPDVDIYYAVKACGDPAVIDILHRQGVAFDVSSIGELKLLQHQKIPVNKYFYTHPYKTPADITAAIEFGCQHFVFDCKEELQKFTAYKQNITLCLRVGFVNKEAVLDLSSKFGCQQNEAIKLLQLANTMGFKVTMLAFHVGSQSVGDSVFCDAINFCADLLADKNNPSLQNINTIDIGGGFPVEYADSPTINYQQFFTAIQTALNNLPSNLKIIAEPGRFLVAEAVISVTSVIACKSNAAVNSYYLDDGIYGAYSGLLYDKVIYPIEYLPQDDNQKDKNYVSKLFGPTCDSHDVVAQEILLPKMQQGDYIIGRMMGAYSIATATNFSCLAKPKIILLK